MERLTYKSAMGDYGQDKTFEDEFDEKCALRNALGKYEDLGMTSEEIAKYLPKYQIGTYVYRIYNNKVFALRVTGFRIESMIKQCKLHILHVEDTWSLFVDDWFNEQDTEIFKTIEEAENALKG
jgi:hypothetical protein